jgi:hypothetical protein
MLDTILLYDATGGGAMTAISPSSLTIKGPSNQKAYLIGYWLDGISVNRLTITCTTNKNFEAAGFVLPPTTDGTAITCGKQFELLPHKMELNGGDVLVATLEAGANPGHAGLFIEYPGEPNYGIRPVQDGEANYVTKPTTATGTNCTAGAITWGTTMLTGWVQGRAYTPLKVAANAAFTTTPIVCLRKLGSNFMLALPVALTDVAQDWIYPALPKGWFVVQSGDSVEVGMSSATAEQPTADVTFAY